MDDAIKLKVISLGTEMFNGKKCFWTPEDLKRIYNLYNLIHNTTHTDTGCPSCRRSKINAIRDIYIQIINALPSESEEH